MKFEVKLFAVLRERTGRDLWRCDHPGPLSGKGLLQAFFDAHPELGGLRHATRLAVNRAFVQGDPLLREEDDLALIPPVSGG